MMSAARMFARACRCYTAPARAYRGIDPSTQTQGQKNDHARALDKEVKAQDKRLEKLEAQISRAKAKLGRLEAQREDAVDLRQGEGGRMQAQANVLRTGGPDAVLRDFDALVPPPGAPGAG